MVFFKHFSRQCAFSIILASEVVFIGKRGWALTIMGILLFILIIILVFKASSWNEELGSGMSRWDETVVSGNGKNKIVQLNVEGIIAEKSSFSSSFSSGAFISQLEQVSQDPNVKAVVIRINSPGGEVVASDEIHLEIERVKQAGKTVVISMGAVAASGGYYISAPADYIFANRSTLTGSLGVIFSLPNYEKTAELLGYKQNTIKSGEFKDIGSPLRELTQKEKDIFQSLVDESYQRFVSVIEKGRKLSHDDVLKAADGRVYSGQQAKALGLIDEFGTLDDATEYAKQKTGLEDVEVVKYAPKFSLFSALNGLNQQLKSPAAQLMEQVLPAASTTGPRLLYLFQP
ncbi:signal peptide peptidase SppA [Paenibacillus planticolens]|uniref:Signal peptide peptidase SppA n=1 Tax=Paenibacillus planticolens TaxID=2654976 RepID=A0ABX1ZL04_9BACL|nr:signal peptide peptidase SppA [Paenibacillus planticolens]NOV00343.1 signal peptide peptidase SppA [Paenibacillus planticolens]